MSTNQDHIGEILDIGCGLNIDDMTRLKDKHKE